MVWNLCIIDIIYHLCLCQEEEPQRQPQIPRKVEVETNFWRSQQQIYLETTFLLSHISNPFKSFFTLNFSCPETTMTDYYKDVVVNNHKLDDLSFSCSCSCVTLSFLCVTLSCTVFHAHVFRIREVRRHISLCSFK